MYVVFYSIYVLLYFAFPIVGVAVLSRGRLIILSILNHVALHYRLLTVGTKMSRLLWARPCCHTYILRCKVNFCRFEVELNIPSRFVRLDLYYAALLAALTVSGAPSIFATIIMGVKINISANKHQYVAGGKVKGIIHVHVTSVSIAGLTNVQSHVLSYENAILTSIYMMKRRHHR